MESKKRGERRRERDRWGSYWLREGEREREIEREKGSETDVPKLYPTLFGELPIMKNSEDIDLLSIVFWKRKSSINPILKDFKVHQITREHKKDMKFESSFNHLKFSNFCCSVQQFEVADLAIGQQSS